MSQPVTTEGPRYVRRSGSLSAPLVIPARSWLMMFSTEAFSAILGLMVTVQVARQLGRAAYGEVEFAATLVGWILVLVRGGCDQIVLREAARRPRLAEAWSMVLLELRFLLALVALLGLTIFALTTSPVSPRLLLIAGLILPIQALTRDVVPRVRGRLGRVAMSQIARSLVHAILAVAILSRWADPGFALVAVLVAETVAVLMLPGRSGDDLRKIHPRWRPRIWILLARRGSVATLNRVARVGLFALDLMILGWLIPRNEALGEYALARRYMLGAAAFGLMVPALMAPRWARLAATNSRDFLRSLVLVGLLLAVGGTVASLLLTLTVPSASAIVMSPPPGFSTTMALVTARLPWIWLSSLVLTALTITRRERSALGWIAVTTMLAILTGPLVLVAKNSIAFVGMWILGLEVVLGIGGGVSLLKAYRGKATSRSPGSTRSRGTYFPVRMRNDESVAAHYRTACLLQDTLDRGDDPLVVSRDVGPRRGIAQTVDPAA